MFSSPASHPGFYVLLGVVTVVVVVLLSSAVLIYKKRANGFFGESSSSLIGLFVKEFKLQQDLLCSLDVLPGFVWVFSGNSDHLPQCKDMLLVGLT